MTQNAFAVSGRQKRKTSASPFANIRLSRTFGGNGGVTWVPDVAIGYRHAAGASGPNVLLVAADSTVFNGNRAELAKDSIVAGAGITAHRSGWTGFIGYRGQFANGWTDHGGSLGLRVAF